MTKKFKLNAEKRGDKDRSAKELRQAAMVPAELYGGEEANQSLKLKKSEAEKIYEQAGESSLIDLEVAGGEQAKVVIKDVQIDPVKDRITHVDLYRVNMKNPIEVEVPVDYEGQAKTVRDMGGTVLKSLESVHIRCLPGDLPDNITVNIDRLQNFDDVIKLSDLEIGGKIEVLTDKDTVVASAVPIYEEKEEEAPAAEAEAEEEAEAGKEKKEKKEEPEAGAGEEGKKQ